MEREIFGKMHSSCALIEKYATDLDIESMPDTKIDMENKVELLEKE